MLSIQHAHVTITNFQPYQLQSKGHHGCDRMVSPLRVCEWIPLTTRCTRYNFMC